ncbi:hypothetical protein [Bordetella sp. FB-8]|uniref:hypothetical protein n=1 Tax=Bordetella sp. FB-8 TaxID=1159870 RepID=UPI000366B1D9|nr:hypothetical protein [Bordetella sp. FB-8]
MPRATAAQLTTLVVTEDSSGAALVKYLPALEYDQIVISIDPDPAAEYFDKILPDLLFFMSKAR